ncbi:hypothetical protein M0R45_024207 [Rubus argutus]|uniref:Uncharacterized protein n=1 Tax=Rubus argutus TaxID=59490 RepID=A0AAW1WUF1_RUBAR
MLDCTTFESPDNPGDGVQIEVSEDSESMRSSSPESAVFSGHVDEAFFSRSAGDYHSTDETSASKSPIPSSIGLVLAVGCVSKKLQVQNHSHNWLAERSLLWRWTVGPFSL